MPRVRDLLFGLTLVIAAWALTQAQTWPPANGSVTPATCTIGQSFWLTTTTNTDLYRCTATNTWTMHDPLAGGGAPTGAQYWAGAADAGLSAEKDLSALATGLVINTAGVPSAYGGTSCTNQFPRSLNASGAGTCSDVAAADFASQIANTFLAAPNGVAGDPTFRGLVGADVPTLNQSTTGNAATATALAANPADCAASQFATAIAASGALTCAALVDADVPNTVTLDNLIQVTARAIGDTTGTLAVARGGTNLTASIDDTMIVGNGTTWESKAIPDCDAPTTSKLLYDVTTNTWSCGTDQGGSGASLTRVRGSSGVAGADFTWQSLSANCAANATTTLATCMTTTGVGAGTWAFKYLVFYQAAATTTGVDFAVNHTGTVTKFVASSHFNTSGGAAATALGDQISSNTATLTEGKSARAINTKFGSSLGVDTANANMLVVIEGVIVVSATGSLELKHASELAASTEVMAETTLELHKVN